MGIMVSRGGKLGEGGEIGAFGGQERVLEVWGFYRSMIRVLGEEFEGCESDGVLPFSGGR